MPVSVAVLVIRPATSGPVSVGARVTEPSDFIPLSVGADTIRQVVSIPASVVVEEQTIRKVMRPLAIILLFLEGTETLPEILIKSIIQLVKKQRLAAAIITRPAV